MWSVQDPPLGVATVLVSQQAADGSRKQLGGFRRELCFNTLATDTPVAAKSRRGVLRTARVAVPLEQELVEKGYGIVKGDYVELSLLEAAYLLDKGELDVATEDGRLLAFQELVRIGASLDSDFWVKLNVYTDLRNRGLRAQPLEGLPIMLVDKKTGEGERRLMVLCLEEGVRIGFKELEAFIRRALESRRDPVLAIVDKEGNISYYIVEKSLG